MRRCIVHIGMHKTGSTSIQDSLSGFSDENFLYARIGNSPNHSLPIFSIFSANPGRHALHRQRCQVPGAVQRYVQSARQDLEQSIAEADTRTLIVCGEGINILDATALQRLRSMLDKNFDNIEVLGYVRPPASFMASEFQTRVKAGVLHKFEMFARYRRYHDIFGKFDEVFGRHHVQLWKFDPVNFAGGDVVSDFCSRLGISLPEAKFMRTNESLPREVVSVLFCYNRYCASRGIESMMPGDYARLYGLFRDSGSAKFRLSPDLVKPTLDANREDIAWMEARLGQPLAEVVEEVRKDDICGEADLLKPQPVVVAKLIELLGDDIPAGNHGQTPDDMAELVHALRLKIMGSSTEAPRSIRPSRQRAPRDRASGGNAWAGRANRIIGADNGANGGKATLRAMRGDELTRKAGLPAARIPIGAQPRPLINCDREIIVIWSPKSACTTAYVWFSQISGFAEDMRKHHVCPHRHRTEVFDHSELYRRGLQSDLSDFRIVRIIRDPYSRAVSIYRHALGTNFAEKNMESFSGGRLGADKGYSFQQFLDLLDSLDMNSCDIHYRPQFHPFEKERRPDKFINISTQDMFAELNVFEVSAALPQTDFKSLDWLHQLEGRRKAKAAEIEGDKLDEVPFSRRDVKVFNRFPSYDQLLTPEARARIEKIYRIDFEAYGDIL